MFPENPNVPVPCSQTPAGPLLLASTELRCCPRCPDDEGSSNSHYFEAQSHGFGTGCLRFVPPSRATTQNSLPGVANLSGWDSSVPTEFLRRVLSFPARPSPWAFMARQELLNRRNRARIAVKLDWRLSVRLNFQVSAERRN